MLDHTRIRVPQCPEDLRRSVRTAVVDDDQLELARQLGPKDLRHRTSNRSLLVVDGHHDRKLRSQAGPPRAECASTSRGLLIPIACESSKGVLTEISTSSARFRIKSGRSSPAARSDGTEVPTAVPCSYLLTISTGAVLRSCEVQRKTLFDHISPRDLIKGHMHTADRGATALAPTEVGLRRLYGTAWLSAAAQTSTAFTTFPTVEGSTCPLTRWTTAGCLSRSRCRSLRAVDRSIRPQCVLCYFRARSCS